MQKTHCRHEEVLDSHDEHPQRRKLWGYLSASIILGSVFWSAVLSASVLLQGAKPISVIAEAVGYDHPIEDPLIVARDSELRLIEPAAGPGSEE